MSHESHKGGDPDFPSAADPEETHTFSCDGQDCREEFTGEGSFQQVWGRARNQRWACKKVDEVWIHLCGDCQ